MANPSQVALIRAHAVSSDELQGTVRRAAWRWVIDRITYSVRRLAAERTARRAVRHLEGCTDQELRDVGIQRSDIPRVVRGPGFSRFPVPEPQLFADDSPWRWPPR